MLDLARTSLRTAVRSLVRHRRSSVLNIVGLCLGLTGCLLMAAYVRQEMAVDDMHDKADRIVRLNKRVTPATGATEYHAITSGAMGPTLADERAEVERAVRVLPWFDTMSFEVEGRDTRDVQDVLFADDGFFETFSFPLLSGQAGHVLEEPGSLVVTASTARRLFGSTDVVGTVVERDGLTLTVTGVAADPPASTHLMFDAVISWKTTVPGQGSLEFGWMNNWITQVTYTYLLLAPGADRGALQASFPSFMERHLPQRADEYSLYLQPLTDVYLGSSGIQYQRKIRLGSAGYVRAFAVIAILLLLIACINVTNLSVAQRMARLRSVGVRKAIGAGAGQIAMQHLTESGVTALVAMAGAIGFAYALLPHFSDRVHRTVRFDLADPWMGSAVAVAIVLVTVLSGTYAAFMMARSRPVDALDDRSGAGSPWVRRALIGGQLAAVVALAAGTLLVYQQVEYAQSKDLGFDDGQILTIDAGGTAVEDGYETFRRELLRHPDIAQVTSSGVVPGGGTSTYEVLPDGRSGERSYQAVAFRLGDEHFEETYGLEVVAGRGFTPERSDASGVVVNETLLRTIGWSTPQEAVGRTLGVKGEREEAVVVGVVADFHVESLRRPIAPVVMWQGDRHSVISVRLAHRNGMAVADALDHIRFVWGTMEESESFSYAWLDDTFASYADEERRLGQLLGGFAGLCLAVACLGLVGLVAQTARRRRREIGIRKAVGASQRSIVGLLTREYAGLSVFAVLIGVPIAYVFVHDWLQNFAYAVPVTVAPFAAGGLAVIGLVSGTVAIQALRAAQVDPAQVLRTE